MRSRLRFLPVLVTFAGCSMLAAQQRESGTANDIYTLSLDAFLERGSDSDIKPDTNDRPAILVVASNFITRSMPRTVGQYRIEYLDGDGLRKRFAEKKSRFPVIEIAPAQTEGGEVVINLRKNWVSFPKKSTLEMAVEGGWIARWRYDCKQAVFVFATLGAWGI